MCNINDFFQLVRNSKYKQVLKLTGSGEKIFEFEIVSTP